MNGRANGRDESKLTKGVLYDAIFDAELPRIPTKATPHRPTPKGDDASPAVVQGVLMAMARHTNPERDKWRGHEATWRCGAGVGLLAEEARCSQRQVQRVLEVLEEAEWIYLERGGGRRAGRPRRGEQPKPATASWWQLWPHQWPQRDLGNKNRAVHDVTSESAEVAQPAAEVAQPTAGLTGSRADGNTKTPPEVAPSTAPEHVSTFKHSLYANTRENPRARAREEIPRDERDESSDDPGPPPNGAQPQPALIAAVEVPRPREEPRCDWCGKPGHYYDGHACASVSAARPPRRGRSAGTGPPRSPAQLADLELADAMVDGDPERIAAARARCRAIQAVAVPA